MSGPSCPCPWQLYVFTVVHLLYSMTPVVVDLCSFCTGRRDEPCNSAEQVTAIFVGLGLLYVAVLFGVLTYVNNRDGPKLKRLAMFGTNCTCVLFSAWIILGSSKLGGFEQSDLHMTDMIVFFALFVVMVSSTADDSPLVGSKSPFEGLGLNPKSVVFLGAIVVLFKLFATSDFVSVESLLKDPDAVTDTARLFSRLLAAIMFEILFGLVFALAYGESKDQEATVFCFVVMIFVSILYTIPIWGHFHPGLIRLGIISGIIYLILCLGAIIMGLKQEQQRAGYETVPSQV